MILGLYALPILDAVCLVAAIALTRFTRRDQPGGTLMVCARFAAVLAQPAALLLTPELAAIPQTQLRRLQDIEDTRAGRRVQPSGEEHTPPAVAPPTSAILLKIPAYSIALCR